MVELLTVIAIVAVLVGILLPVVGRVREQARITGTVQRMQQVVSALQEYAAGDRTLAVLQRAATLGAPDQLMALHTVRISLPAGSAQPPALFATGTNRIDDVLVGERTLEVMPPRGLVVPSAAWWTAQWPFLWPETDWPSLGAIPPILPWPWGRPGLCLDLVPTTPGTGTGATGRMHGNPGVAVQNRYMIGNASGSEPVAASRTITRSDGTDETVSGDQPYPFDLGWASPLRTTELLAVAGIIEPGAAGTAQYRDDRSPQRPWNDLWGHPLVVVYALFHPARDAHTGQRDRYARAALRQYGYSKAAYISVGATGPELRDGIDGTASSPASLRDRWNQIRAVCEAQQWTEHAFASPPQGWKDYRVGRQRVAGKRELCVLLAPAEIKSK